jgi:hypothetical protein
MTRQKHSFRLEKDLRQQKGNIRGTRFSSLLDGVVIVAAKIEAAERIALRSCYSTETNAATKG